MPLRAVGWGGEGASGRVGEASGRARQRAASGVRGVMSCVRSGVGGLEGLVISRGKSVPLGLGTLS